MERIILLLLCALCLVTIRASLTNRTEERYTSSTKASPIPAIDKKASVYTSSKHLSGQEYNTSSYILLFGVIVLVIEIGLMLLKQVHPQKVIKFSLLTVVLIAALFLVAANYTLTITIISQALGLLGTIAGYLLGRAEVNLNSSERGLLYNRQPDEF
jgi:NADH:ubiquinone oxidoreductase subunit 3 (subunit A)